MSAFDIVRPSQRRWTAMDLVRTAADRSVLSGGVLEVQDDLRPISTPTLQLVEDTPFERLSNAVDLTDYRQRRRLPDEARGRAQGTRKLQTIRALWLHQTAALLASPHRFLSVPVQGGIDTRAGVVLLHPLRAYMFHGHAANRFSIGVEVACRAAGIEGDPETFVRSKREREGYRKRNGVLVPPKTYEQLVHEPSDEVLEATFQLCCYYILEVERQAAPLRAQGIEVPGIIEIGTHRLSHKSRVADPGSRIYQEVVLRLMREFGLREAKPVGSGRLNPTAWTGEGRVAYSWKVRGF